MPVLPRKYAIKITKGGPKFRMVVLGCWKLCGIDYNETYAPVFKLESVRSMLPFVADLHLECEQMDVVTGFVCGDLDKDISMEVPAGFKHASRDNKVSSQ